MDAGAVHERVWRPAWPCPVAGLYLHRRGPGDPTFRVDPDRTLWRGLRTPEGTATLAVRPIDAGGDIKAAAWGQGAAWALEQLPDLLGASDDVSGFDPQHPVLAKAWALHPHRRVPKSGLVYEALLPAILEQKVTGKEAFESFRRLVRAHGEPAPGPQASARRLMVSPTPAVVRSIASWQWLDLHVDHARSRLIVAVSARASALERITQVSLAEADKRLRSFPGLGVWTSAEVRQRALGDADAVSFGDYHVAKDIGWALTGTPVDDAGLADLLEPYRPHRLRVQMLVSAAGLHRPRRGPRMSLPTHLPRPLRGS